MQSKNKVYRTGLSILSLLVIIVLFNVQQLNVKIQKHLKMFKRILFNVRFTLCCALAVKYFGLYLQLDTTERK